MSYFVVVYELFALGGIVVSVLATEPKIQGSKPAEDSWATKIRCRLPSEGK
jgi:hypothetical protein